jgi:hypothetical protein
MNEVETTLEGVVIGILLRLLFGFDVSLAVTCAAGVGSRLATAYLGAGYVPPDYWVAELVICSGVTLAMLGTLQTVRANW